MKSLNEKYQKIESELNEYLKIYNSNNVYIINESDILDRLDDITFYLDIRLLDVFKKNLEKKLDAYELFNKIIMHMLVFAPLISFVSFAFSVVVIIIFFILKIGMDLLNNGLDEECDYLDYLYRKNAELNKSLYNFKSLCKKRSIENKEAMERGLSQSKVLEFELVRKRKLKN